MLRCSCMCMYPNPPSRFDLMARDEAYSVPWLLQRGARPCAAQPLSTPRDSSAHITARARTHASRTGFLLCVFFMPRPLSLSRYYYSGRIVHTSTYHWVVPFDVETILTASNITGFNVSVFSATRDALQSRDYGACNHRPCYFLWEPVPLDPRRRS